VLFFFAIYLREMQEVFFRPILLKNSNGALLGKFWE